MNMQAQGRCDVKRQHSNTSPNHAYARASSSTALTADLKVTPADCASPWKLQLIRLRQLRSLFTRQTVQAEEPLEPERLTERQGEPIQAAVQRHGSVSGEQIKLIRPLVSISA